MSSSHGAGFEVQHVQIQCSGFDPQPKSPEPHPGV